MSLKLSSACKNITWPITDERLALKDGVLVSTLCIPVQYNDIICNRYIILFDVLFCFSHSSVHFAFFHLGYKVAHFRCHIVPVCLHRQEPSTKFEMKYMCKNVLNSFRRKSATATEICGLH